MATAITINFNIGGEKQKVSILPSETIGELRKQIVKLMKSMGATGKLKNISISFKDTILTDRPRMTVNKSGLVDGSIVQVGDGLTGGGKRKGGETFEVKLQEISDVIQLSELRLNASNVAFFKDTVAYFKNIVKKVDADPKAFKEHLKSLPIDTLKKMEVIAHGTNTETKIGNITKLCFSEVTKTNSDIVRASNITENSSKKLLEFLLLKSFASETNPSINWKDFSTTVVDLISDKSGSEAKQDVSMK